MSEDEREATRRNADHDPRDDRTQPMFASPAPSLPRDPQPSGAPDDDPEATTWAQSHAPPRLIDDESTERVSKAGGGVSADAEWGPDEAATVVSETFARTGPEDSRRATIAPSSSLHPMLLERVEPSLGRGERVRLDAAHWRVSLGRAEHNDLRLYTASASREHAVIAGNEAGQWVLTPAEGKSVKIDGDPVSEPVVLEVGMNLVMGGDHLRCVTEGLEGIRMAAQTAADGFRDDSHGGRSRLSGIGFSWWLIGGIALLGLGLIAFAWWAG